MRFVDNRTQCENEASRLAQDAQLVGASQGRFLAADEDLLRNDYQRDRDRIIHTKAFRRLSHKTQVFLAPEGDHFRTRLTHTLEVSQIARTVARALSLNEDLTEAIALGHDLGHTPFGHAGESALNACLVALAIKEGQPLPQDGVLFRHNEQSLRVVDYIENSGKGLNLTFEVRDGIANHTGDFRPRTLEGRIVAVSDRIAYVNHDIDDAIRAGMLVPDALPETTRTLLGTSHSQRINTLVTDLVQNSLASGDIRMSEGVWDAMMELREFLFVNIYKSERVLKEVSKAEHVVRELFAYFLENPSNIPDEYIALGEGNVVRSVIDYIACMTDRYAKHLYQHLFIPSALDSVLDD